ncbi:ABC transporter [Fusobacterium nucleatum subsp. nucleatum]|uniref:ABC transporter n=1 Tax=Fusobacterium nucleatum subsp. nucleatum TaxID=76856 RepID=A0A0X3Y3X3_FUSNC|nr:ABC transporter [Fusobacterium nucleatum subsp. nucleatum]
MINQGIIKKNIDMVYSTSIKMIAILIFACAITLTLFKSLPHILKVQKKLDRMILVLRERFIGSKIIRAFDNSKKRKR